MSPHVPTVPLLVCLAAGCAAAKPLSVVEFQLATPPATVAKKSPLPLYIVATPTEERIHVDGIDVLRPAPRRFTFADRSVSPSPMTTFGDKSIFPAAMQEGLRRLVAEYQRAGVHQKVVAETVALDAE